MASNELEIEQSTTKLKHLEVLKKIVVRVVVLLSNVYAFAKENFSSIKSTAENTVVSTERQKLVELAEEIIVFLDDKFDKYASSSVKELLAQFQSLVYKTEPVFNILLTTTQTLVVPLITINIFLLQITKYLIQNITTKFAPLVSDAETPLQEGLNASQTTESLLQSSLDATKSLVPDTILQTGPDIANQVADTTKSLVGSLPLVGNAAQSLVTNPTDVANQILNTTNSLVNNNRLLNSAVPESILQTGSDLANQAQDITKSLVGGIPLVGNVAQSLVTNPTDVTNQIVNENPILGAVSSVVGDIPLVDNVAPSLVTNPTDLANQIVNTTSSLVNENPLLDVVNSVAQSTLDTTNTLVPDTILQKSPDIVNQVVDTTKSVVEDIPLVGNVAQSLVTNPADLASQIVSTTDTLVNENPVVDAVNSVAQNSLDTAKSVLETSNNKALSAVGGLFGLNKK